MGPFEFRQTVLEMGRPEIGNCCADFDGIELNELPDNRQLRGAGRVLNELLEFAVDRGQSLGDLLLVCGPVGLPRLTLSLGVQFLLAGLLKCALHSLQGELQTTHQSLRLYCTQTIRHNHS